MALTDPPARIVEGGRVAAFGTFAGVIAHPDLESHRPWGPLSFLRLKRWHHLAVVHPEVGLTLALVDAGIQRLGWLQGIDRRTGRVVERARQSPLLDVRVGAALGDDRSWLRARGLRLEWHAHLDAGRHELTAEGDGVSARLVLHAGAATPLEVVLPVGRGRAMWSHKVPLPAEGEVTVGDRRVVLDPAHTTAILDLHKAHYPHHTFWRWGTFAEVDGRGRRLAVNLTHNLVDADGMHENAVWVDGALSLLARPDFRVQDDPWSAAGDGYALAFRGDGERREDLNLGLVVSRFRQRFGRWTGTVAGREVADAWGLAEDHTSAW